MAWRRPSRQRNGASHGSRIAAATILAGLLATTRSLFANRGGDGPSMRTTMAPPAAASAPGEDGPAVDFAIIGFPKTGTTFLQEVLRTHPSVLMPDGEMCGIHTARGQKKLDRFLEASASTRSDVSGERKQLGIKCPSFIRQTHDIEKLAEYSTETRLVVGLRHPVHFFQSFYNYRVREHYKFKRKGEIPDALELGNHKDWQGVSTAYAKFDLYLKQLAKVPLLQSDMESMLKSDSLWEKRISPTPFKVFAYTLDQLRDRNETRQVRFQNELQTFLRLKSPIEGLWEPHESLQYNETYPEYIDICDDEFETMRYWLVHIGKRSGDWITRRFINAEDVVVSDVDHFTSSLATWGEDPCVATDQ